MYVKCVKTKNANIVLIGEGDYDYSVKHTETFSKI